MQYKKQTNNVPLLNKDVKSRRGSGHKKRKMRRRKISVCAFILFNICHIKSEAGKASTENEAEKNKDGSAMKKWKQAGPFGGFPALPPDEISNLS